MLDIRLSFSDMPDNIENLEYLCGQLTGNFDYSVDEEKIWETIRRFDYGSIPSVSNIYMEQLFNDLENAIHEKYGENIECKYWINCRDSSFSCEGEHIVNMQDLERAIENCGKLENKDEENLDIESGLKL